MIARWRILQEDSGVIGHQSGSISGWELMDFIKRPPVEFTMKKANNGSSDCGWETLAAEKDTLVLFYQDAGDVIRPPASSSLCADWKPPPKHKHYLIASLASLEQMALDYGGFRTYTRLSGHLAWRPTTEAIFEEHCKHGPGHKCKKLQQLVSVSVKWKAHHFNFRKLVLWCLGEQEKPCRRQ